MEPIPSTECIALGAVMFIAGLGVPFEYGMKQLRAFGKYVADGLLKFGKFVVDKLPPNRDG